MRLWHKDLVTVLPRMQLLGQWRECCLIAKSIKGKGVSFMENNAGWHGKAPNAEQFAQAKVELEAAIAALEG